MNITRDERQQQPERAGGAGRAAVLGRRSVLGGLAALPVLYGVGTATPALAATAARPVSTPHSDTDLVRGAERRYNAPLLTAGTRLLLPTGIKAVAVQDYYSHPRLALAESVWPRMAAADGATVDASIVPERGAPTRIAMLSGFTEGWYELVHATGRADRVTWDADKLPFLWFYGEFGATGQAPYYGRFYTLALQPFSRNPYSRTTFAH